MAFVSRGQPVAIIRSLAESVENVEKVLVLAQDIHSSGVELRYSACIFVSVSGLHGRSCACAVALKATEDVKFTSPTSTESRHSWRACVGCGMTEKEFRFSSG